MPNLTVRRFDRSAASPQMPPRIALAVESYAWSVIGGPEKATIAASGDVAQLWECIEWLRCPIEIVDQIGRAVWWGFVQAVSLQAGAIEFGVSLETMANKIAVAYTARTAANPTGGRATTAWLADAVSTGTYGIKELLLSADVPDSATALALRATALASRKYPVPTLRVGDGEQVSATITCVGWWATAEWRYYADTPGRITYTDEGTHAYYTAQSISFNGASDDIDDSAGGLGVFAVGDSILVTGVDTRGVYTVDSIGTPNTNLHVAEDLGGHGAGDPVELENQFVTVGYNAAARKIAQSFVVPADRPLDLETISIYARTFDNPTSLRLYLELYTDNAGEPGTLLAAGFNARGEEGFSGSQEVPAAAPTDFISDEPPMSLVTYTMLDDFGDVVTLSAGSTYWLVLDTDADSGFNGAEFFIAQRNTAGSSPGNLLRWDGSAWVATAGVLLHIISGAKETTLQIEEIVAGVMPFLSGVVVEADSGVFNNSYRDGDSTAKAAIEELLATGTTAGKRLLANVTRERYLRVYEEPAVDGDAARLGADGLLRDSMGNPIPAHTCPVGMWVKLVDVIPATADTSTLGSPSPFFVDRAEYSAKTNRLHMEPKAAPSIRDLERVQPG